MSHENIQMQDLSHSSFSRWAMRETASDKDMPSNVMATGGEKYNGAIADNTQALNRPLTPAFKEIGSSEVKEVSTNPNQPLGIHDFPDLPLVNKSEIEYGKPVTLDLHKEAYAPSPTTSIRSFLAKPPLSPQPPPPILTFRHKAKRKTRRAWLLTVEPATDPDLLWLPRGIRTKLREKDPFTDRLVRRFRKKRERPTSVPTPRDQVRIPSLTYFDTANPPPERPYRKIPQFTPGELPLVFDTAIPKPVDKDLESKLKGVTPPPEAFEWQFEEPINRLRARQNKVEGESFW